MVMAHKALRRAARRRGQAHDRHQRRRSLAAELGGRQRDQAAEGHGLDGGRRRARAGRQPRAAEHWPATTGGKYYVVNNPKALPRIFQREARRVARPLIYENADRRAARKSGSRTRCSAASSSRCRRSTASC